MEVPSSNSDLPLFISHFGRTQKMAQANRVNFTQFIQLLRNPTSAPFRVKTLNTPFRRERLA
jgi:hypothetical protein